jgi:hypothetical protein
MKYHVTQSEFIDTLIDTTYNGWKNRETWNVALWLGNEYVLYCAAKGYAKYATPYLSLRQDLRETFNFTKTMDGVSLWNRELDIKALDECINEMGE